MKSNLKSAIVADLDKYRSADLDRIGAAVACGANLLVAKEQMQHGKWLPFLREMGLAERTASRWMYIVQIGLKADSVRPCGGINSADERFREVARDTELFESMGLDEIGKARYIAEIVNEIVSYPGSLEDGWAAYLEKMIKSLIPNDK